jgi:hypothetical protein
LSLYALACRQAFRIDPRAVSYYFLAHDTKLSAQRTGAQMRQAALEVEAVGRRIMHREFEPRPESCPKCDFKKSCAYSSSRRK